ncbi:MAG TPA: MtrB/PioB family decaheme-associated outer membrane protein [Gallionella sp.]|nr:MtrB/PioB family decaheme-associated outer membrane protein [Gallionella sp.]
METCNEKMKISLMALAVQGALTAMFALPLAAYAADESEELAALKRPTNSVEIGVDGVSKKSAKFGEYTGLDKSGAKLIGNFDIRGGNAYDGGGGTTRWSINGRDLGLTSRSAGATISNQGQWTIGIGYDELRHNISDTYQTPLQGVVGGNIFTLPPTFGYVGAQPLAPATVTLDATKLGAFHTVDVGTTRKNTSFNAGYNFNPQLSVQFGYNRLKQSGAKLMGSGTLGTKDVAAGGGTWRAEAISILMNPTNYQTNNIDLALNWIGDKGHLTGSYYSSRFSNGYDRFTWENAYKSGAAVSAPCGFPPCTYQTTTMSTAPNNDFHQLNVSGGYAFSSSTKLAGGISYGRNTQNAAFLTGNLTTVPEIPAAFILPQVSLNGLVVTRHADLKLTHQATKDLALSAGFKLNERDNRSPANIYQYWALNGNGGTVALPAGIDVATNAPYSNKKTELELAGDYRLDKRQSLRLAYVHEKISRWCNGMVLPYSNCVVVPSNSEDRLGLSYRLRTADGVGFNASYTYAARKALFNHDAVTPLAGLNLNVVAVTLPTDVNAQDYPGFAAHIYDSRRQHLLKAAANWQATEKLDLSLTGRYVHDKYDAYLGVQNSRTTGLNLDATYSRAENASYSAYMSWQRSRRDLRSGLSVPANAAANAGPSYAALLASVALNPLSIWSNQLTDNGSAIGIRSKHTGLMNGKLELDGDLSYSFDTTGYATQLQYVSAQCSPTNMTACGALPDIKSRLLTLKLIGSYQLNKSDKLGLGLIHQKLTADDYFYNAYLYGSAPLRIMPTNQQSGSYSANVVAVSYIHTFR